jgi:hypothetical protein
MDEVDVGNYVAEQMLAASLAEVARRAKKDAQPFTGKCLYCGDPVADFVRFCSGECSDDYTWLAESRKRRGLG